MESLTNEVNMKRKKKRQENKPERERVKLAMEISNERITQWSAFLYLFFTQIFGKKLTTRHHAHNLMRQKQLINELYWRVHKLLIRFRFWFQMFCNLNCCYSVVRFFFVRKVKNKAIWRKLQDFFTHESCKKYKCSFFLSSGNKLEDGCINAYETRDKNENKNFRMGRWISRTNVTKKNLLEIYLYILIYGKNMQWSHLVTVYLNGFFGFLK